MIGFKSSFIYSKPTTCWYFLFDSVYHVLTYGIWHIPSYHKIERNLNHLIGNNQHDQEQHTIQLNDRNNKETVSPYWDH